MDNIIGERLKELRKEKKKTQTEIASLLGLTEGAYRHYESGRSKPSAEDITKLAEYFDVSTDYLLGRSDYRQMVPTIAAHSDDPKGLPPEAQEEVMQYIEFIKQKYGIGKEGK